MWGSVGGEIGWGGGGVGGGGGGGGGVWDHYHLFEDWLA